MTAVCNRCKRSARAPGGASEGGPARWSVRSGRGRNASSRRARGGRAPPRCSPWRSTAGKRAATTSAGPTASPAAAPRRARRPRLPGGRSVPDGESVPGERTGQEIGTRRQDRTGEGVGTGEELREALRHELHVANDRHDLQRERYVELQAPAARRGKRAGRQAERQRGQGGGGIEESRQTYRHAGMQACRAGMRQGSPRPGLLCAGWRRGPPRGGAAAGGRRQEGGGI